MNWNNFSLGLLKLTDKPLKQSNQLVVIKTLFEKTYAQAICTKGNVSYSPGNETIKSWLKKENKANSDIYTVSIKISRLYPDDVIPGEKNKELFEYFRGQSNGKWRDCQKQFAKIHKAISRKDFSSIKGLINDTNENFRVDIQTRDEGIFRISLIKQFTTLLHIDDMSDNEESELLRDFRSRASYSDVQEPMPTETDVSSSEVGSYSKSFELSSFHNNNAPENSAILEDGECSNDGCETRNKQEEASTFISELTIPDECHICLFCKRWQGNIFDVEQSLTEGEQLIQSQVESKCSFFKKDMTASSKACPNFKAHYNRVSLYIYKGITW